jgi:hypothetical protein
MADLATFKIPLGAGYDGHTFWIGHLFWTCRRHPQNSCIVDCEDMTIRKSIICYFIS